MDEKINKIKKKLILKVNPIVNETYNLYASYVDQNQWARKVNAHGLANELIEIIHKVCELCVQQKKFNIRLNCQKFYQVFIRQKEGYVECGISFIIQETDYVKI